ncbi:MAG: hypothetical protein LBJ01_04050 [Tannerella sp.]|jgi:hypothetical protein|nr:hypothetical protein [Tannerella sp.]
MPIPEIFVNRHSPAGADAPLAPTVSPASGQGLLACTDLSRNRTARSAVKNGRDPSRDRRFRAPDGIAKTLLSA